ncbi:arginine N-succinyltransferase [Litoribrevibacter albus]|uniref:Arginine N-succinyltransferase subunit alpha n=1 Tax=Litoribrevibacter albus TaxID=1473156 RepID=A0AA37SCM8_9GAMM|nr:arginine N-succinyltransferase [Litoribrevibacter albus]GLQ32919.1 arginine N-succinyltransferase subunit alpha [Litoribrevibacter albus]
MYSLRPAKQSDLDAILVLACNQGKRQASLPKEAHHLRLMIQQSEEAFRQPHNSASSSIQSLRKEELASNYLWVLCYTNHPDQTPSVIGTIAIEPYTGQKEPFYSYRQETLINASYRLKVKQDIPVLYQSHELAGLSQLHAMTIASEHRNSKAISLLVQGALLYMAEHTELFCPSLLIEFPGFKDERDQSPLWRDLGQHFFQMTLEEACYHASIEDKALIAQLMPNHPLYKNLLSNTTQATLGEPQQDLLDYYQIFLREGFSPSQHLDIFDGGPCLICTNNSGHTFNENARLRLEQLQPSPQPCILMNTQKHHPMAIYSNFENEWSLESIDDVLNITPQEWIRTVPAHVGEDAL